MIKKSVVILLMLIPSLVAFSNDQEIKALLDSGIINAVDYGFPQKGLDFTASAFDLAKKRNDKYQMVKALGNIGYISIYVGDYAAAQINVGRAYQSLKKLDTVDLYRETLYLTYLADISRDLNDYEKAIQLYEVAHESAVTYINKYPEIGEQDSEWLYSLPLNKAYALEKTGRIKEATQTLMAIWKDASNKANPLIMAQIYNHIGLLKMKSNDYLAAQEFFGKITSNPEVDNQTKAMAYHNLGWSYMVMKDYDKAEKYYQIALTNKDSLNVASDSKFITLLDLGELKFNQGEYSEAIGFWDLAVQISPNIEKDPDVFKIYEWYDKAYTALGSAKAYEYKDLYARSWSDWRDAQKITAQNPELAIFNTRIDNIIAEGEASARRLRDIKRYWPFAAMALVILFFFVYQMQIILNKRRDRVFEGRLKTDRAFKADEILKQIRRD